MKTLRSLTSPTTRILVGSIAALLAVHSVNAQTTISSGQSVNIDPATFFPTAGTVTIEAGGTLRLTQGGQSAPPGGTPISNSFVFAGGEGSIGLQFNNNDTKWSFTGPFTSTATAHQTFAIATGINGNGDREDLVFATSIPNGANGNTLGLDVTYRTQSDSSSYVNLTVANAFDGDIALHQGNSNVRGYLVIGGERYEMAFDPNQTRYNTQATAPSAGTLGNGHYAGAISLDVGTILNYNSSAAQILSGNITGGGSLLVTGTNILTLSGVNTFTGNTIVQGDGNTNNGNGQTGTGTGGILAIGAPNALPTNGTVTLVNNPGVGLNLNGFNQSIVSLIGGGTTGGHVNLGTDGVLTIGNSTSTYAGVISGAGTAGLTKQGGGTLTLSSSATHTFTGDTTINAGILALTGNLSSANVNLNNFGKLKLVTATDHPLGGNLIVPDNGTLEVTASGTSVGRATLTGSLDIIGTPVVKLSVSGSFSPLSNTLNVIHWAGADPEPGHFEPWTFDSGNLAVVNAGLDQASNWSNNPTADNSWDTETNWSQQQFTGGEVVYDLPAKNVNIVLSTLSIAPVPTSQVSIAPTNPQAVTGPASPATVASLTVGNSGTNAHALTLQPDAAVAVTGAVTVNPSGTLHAADAALSAGTLNLSGGSVILGPGSTAGVVNLNSGTLAATVDGNELAVTTKAVQGSMVITAGTSAFKLGGTNLVNNIDKLIIQGGTTSIAAPATITLADVGTQWTGTIATSFSNNFTISPGANVLVVTVNQRTLAPTGAAYDSTTHPTVTYNGVAMTLNNASNGPHGYGQINGFTNSMVFYMLNAPTGSADALAVTFPYAGTDFVVNAFTLAGANTSVPVVTNHYVQETTNTPNNLGITLTGVSAGSAVVSSYMQRNTSPVSSSTSSGTLITTGTGGGSGDFWSYNGPNTSAAGALALGVAAGTVTITHSSATAAREIFAAAAFAPGSAALALSSTTLSVAATTTNTLSFGGAPAVSLDTLTMEISSAVTFTNAPGVTFTHIIANGTSQINGSVPITISSGEVSVASGEMLTVGSPLLATTLTKQGDGTLTLGVAAILSGVAHLASTAGTTNINSALATGTATVTLTGASSVKFGSVSQNLASLSIGAGSTATFTSDFASFSGSGGKGGGFSGGSVVPEPGTLGLLLVGALGALHRRRRD